MFQPQPEPTSPVLEGAKMFTDRLNSVDSEQLSDYRLDSTIHYKLLLASRLLCNTLRATVFPWLSTAQKQREGPPAMVTPLGYPELTIAAETVRGHVVRHPPGDLQTDTPCKSSDTRCLSPKR